MSSNKNVPINKNNQKKKMTSKQIAAIVAVVLLVALYLVTLFAAIFDTSAAKNLFWICLFGTFVIPLLTWVYIWMYGKLAQKHTIADFDLGGEPTDNTRK